MISANIPLSKPKNANFRNFLSKFIGINISEELTMRNNCVGACHNNTINSIRAYVENKNLWASIDETTDVDFANAIYST